MPEQTIEVKSTTETSAPIPVRKHKAVLGQFGDGRYSQAMKEVFQDSQRLFGFTPLQAHAIGERLGVDAGQLQSASVRLKYGSLTKDGKRSLKEVTKAIKVTESWALTVGFLCAGIDDLRKQGLVVHNIKVADDIIQSVDTAASRIEQA